MRARMKAAAKRYWLEGFNVVAIKYEEGKGKVAKKPFSVWGKWHKQRLKDALEVFHLSPNLKSRIKRHWWDDL
jgi:hypothetical protein